MLEEIGTWWRQHALEHEPRVDIDHHGVEPSLGLVLHPAVEPVVFEIPAPGTLTITANTSTGGPGYHRTLVGGLKRMARDLSIDWANGQLVQGLGDETRYFETGDTGAVDEVMLDWAHGLAEAIIDHADADATDFTIGMPPDWGFQTDAFATTSLGPRDRQFFERIAKDRAAGVALFPWWPDRLDAAFYRDRALVRMWSDVRWRPPLDDVESRVLVAVDRDLERAAAGGAPGIPWDAWTEVRALVGRPPVAGPDGDRDTGGITARIGYRRGQVRVRFADWELEVPGSLAEATTDDGDRVLFDDTANIRVSTFERSDRSEDESATDAIMAYGLTDGQVAAVVDEEGIVGWASERKLEGDDAGFVALQGLVAAPAALAFVTISHAPARADWAAATFRSIRWKPFRDEPQADDHERPPVGPTWTPEERDRVLVQAGLGAAAPRTRYAPLRHRRAIQLGQLRLRPGDRRRGQRDPR